MAVPTRLRMYEMGDLGGCSALWHPLRRRASSRLSSSCREADPDIGGARTPASQTCDTPPHAGRSGGAVRTRLDRFRLPPADDPTRRFSSPQRHWARLPEEGRGDSAVFPPPAPGSAANPAIVVATPGAGGGTWGCWGRRNPAPRPPAVLTVAGRLVSELDDRAGQRADDPIDQLEGRDDHLA
jgi:hypothetical protein